jgi:protein-tyrosine phosphatase
VDAEERRRILEGLLAAGIGTVINLTESGEVNHYGIELYDYSADFRASGLETVRKPIVDVSIPTFEDMDGILDLIDDRLANDKPVYFHCWGGVGRTGTVLGCYLLTSNMAKLDNVFDTIDQLKRESPMRHRNSPETEEQKDFVREYIRYRESRV